MRGRHGLFACCLSALLLAPLSAEAQPLAPPPPMTMPGAPDAHQAETTRRLDEAEQKDSGRNFELVWIDAQAGGAYIDMAQLSSSSFELEKTTAAGPAFSVGAGARFVLFVLGARARYNMLSSFDMWQINGEAGLKLPVSSLDILIGVHGGYSFVGRLDQANLATNTGTPTSADAVSIRGFNAGLDVAIDYYLTPLFSIGAGLLGDVLFLKRPPAALPAGFASLPAERQAAIKGDPLYERSGSSAGLQLAGGLRLGLHFGL